MLRWIEDGGGDGCGREMVVGVKWRGVWLVVGVKWRGVWMVFVFAGRRRFLFNYRGILCPTMIFA